MRLSELLRLGRADGWIDVARGELDCDAGWEIQSSVRASSHGSFSILLPLFDLFDRGNAGNDFQLRES
jgi:hypothetical protein